MRLDKEKELEEYENKYLKKVGVTDTDSDDLNIEKESDMKEKYNMEISAEVSDKYLSEVLKLKDNIDSDEKVLYAVKQMRAKPGGARTSPNSVILTDKKIIIRNPTMFGARENIEEIPYEEVTSVKLEKGLLSSTVVFRVPGLSDTRALSGSMLAWGRGEDGAIDGIPKDKADRLVTIIREQIKIHKQQPQQSSNVSEDPIKALKLRFAKGEITKEEFLEMKSMLE